MGGISEVQHLQMELMEVSRKVKSVQEALHDYIGAITSAQEEGRTRLARELHDDTVQALKQRVQHAQKSSKDQQGKQSLADIELLAEQTIENLRCLTRALRPIYLEDLGLDTLATGAHLSPCSCPDTGAGCWTNLVCPHRKKAAHEKRTSSVPVIGYCFIATVLMLWLLI